MTNKEKFKEVFGFTPDDNAVCLMPRARELRRMCFP